MLQENRVKCLNPWDSEGKRIFETDGIMQTLFAGEGGHLRGVCYAIEGNTVDRASGKNGRGWCENVSPTLNTQDRHAVAYIIDALSSNSMKSSNPHSGFHVTTVSKCLDTSCCEPTCNQGGVVIVESHRP